MPQQNRHSQARVCVSLGESWITWKFGVPSILLLILLVQGLLMGKPIDASLQRLSILRYDISLLWYAIHMVFQAKLGVVQLIMDYIRL